MRCQTNVATKYQEAVWDAFDKILDKGNSQHKKVMRAILDSKMLICVAPASEVMASGITGVINPANTNKIIELGALTLEESLEQVFITIAEETIDGGGQRGCEGTFVHEGQHAYDFAKVIESFSQTDSNPLSIFNASVFNPTLYEMEWAAHKTSGEYMRQIGKEDYLQEGFDLMILGRNELGYFLSEEGIKRRLRESYGLEENGNQGSLASDMVGLKQRL